MEKKLHAKTEECERLEEENIGLKEVTKLMAKQIEKIEEQLAKRTDRQSDLNADLKEIEELETQLFSRNFNNK
jgi:vacuolar-type H+-ATPase subunit I/STV1